MVKTPLRDDFNNQFSLHQLEYEKRLDEMEFFLPVAGLSPRQLEGLLGSSQRFDFNYLTGYLKGFIDLIFCHNGRYYVADYKSNHLGFTVADYSQANLSKAMQEHAYDMQAWIYTLALEDRKSTRLNSSHVRISYAVFCLKKKNKYKKIRPTPRRPTTPRLTSFRYSRTSSS